MRRGWFIAFILLTAGCNVEEPSLPAGAAEHLQDAITALRSHAIQEALAHADSALLLAPEHPYGHFVKGQAYYLLADFAAARWAWEKASALEPAYFAWWQSLGDVAFRQADFAASLKYYERALRLSPDAISWHGAAGAYWEMSQPLEARRACEQALALDSTYAPAYLSLSMIAEHEGELHEALRLAHRAIDFGPEYTPSFLVAGRLHRLLEKPLEAIPLLQKALEAAPGSSEIRYNLAQALQQAGLSDEAARVWEATNVHFSLRGSEPERTLNSETQPYRY